MVAGADFLLSAGFNLPSITPPTVQGAFCEWPPGMSRGLRSGLSSASNFGSHLINQEQFSVLAFVLTHNARLKMPWDVRKVFFCFVLFFYYAEITSQSPRAQARGGSHHPMKNRQPRLSGWNSATVWQHRAASTLHLTRQPWNASPSKH